MKKAVIFDMDGVLSDTEWIYVDKILEFLREKGIGIPASQINDLFGQTMLTICKELKSRYQLSGDPRLFADRIHALRDAHIKEYGIFPMEGAVTLVKALYKKGVPMAVASSAPGYLIRSNMRHFGIEACFSYFVSGRDCVCGKPDPEIYLRAAELLNVSPSECVVIEDSSNGVNAAKNAGMYCIAFVPKKAVPQDISRADRILTSFVGLDIDSLFPGG